MNKFDTDKAQSAIYDKYGAFFAFSDEQFNESKKPDTEYSSIGYGLICPAGSEKDLAKELSETFRNKIAWELEHNSKKDIIWYELANHECQITYSYEDIIEIMAAYGITEDDIKAEWSAYIDHCVEHDYL